jgi:hypothetical protein
VILSLVSGEAEAAAVDGFLASELFAAVGATPGLVDISVRRFGVLAAPTEVTRGLAVTAASNAPR